MKKNLLLLSLSLAIAAALLEVAVRIAFPVNLAIERVETDYFREGVGLLKTPGQTARNIQACYAATEITFNSLGFRDNEIPTGVPPEVGILGPSLLEAMQVSDREHTAALMEDMIGKPVLNMAIGGASTVKSMQMYHHLMSEYRPRTVLLFFLTGNNIRDNGCRTKAEEVQTLGLPAYTGTCGTIVKGEAVYREPWQTEDDARGRSAPPVTRSRFDPIGWLRTDCRSCRMINDVLKGTFGVSLSPTTQSEEDGYRTGLNVYRPLEALSADARASWEEAWQVTEAALVRLRDEVASRGGQFVLVPVTEHMVVSREWRSEFKTAYGYPPREDLDPARPARILKDIASRRQISIIDTDELFLGYRDRFDLKFPYFSFSCDGHWNPFGHFLLASWVSQKLVEGGHLAVGDADAFVRARQRERERAPAMILTDPAFRAIYGGGIFRSAPAISSLRPQ
jgi:hypothetical protein